MLSSKHIFIQQGDLKYNDNGRKKFNKSEMRRFDRQLMEWVSDVNDRLVELPAEKKYVLIFQSETKSFFERYTQIMYTDFVEIFTVSENSICEVSLSGTDSIVYVFAGTRKEFFKHPGLKVDAVFLCDLSLNDILGCEHLELYFPEVVKILHESTLGRLKKLNDVLETIPTEEKIIIYGGGYQTEFFFRYANIKRLDIVGIVDIKQTKVFNEIPDIPSKEVLEKADSIIVTPFYAVQQIKTYLKSIDISKRIIYIADICDNVVFSAHEMCWAPDLPQMEYEKRIPIDFAVDKLRKDINITNQISPFFASVKVYEPYISHLQVADEIKKFQEKTAFLLQGPVDEQQEFTYNTIKMYHKYFPYSKIVVSTGNDEVLLKYREELSSWNVKIIHSDMPNVPGYQNINLQLATTFQGLEYVKKHGYSYAMKTRTDLRLYSPYILHMMYWFMKCVSFSSTHLQKERIIILPPRLDYFFFIPDFFMFGNVDDLLNYWTTENLFSNRYIGEAAETLLGRRYAKFLGEEIPNNLHYVESYKKMIQRYFAVVDDRMTDMIWHKYFYHKNWVHEYHYNVMDFVDWLEGQSFYADVLHE